MNYETKILKYIDLHPDKIEKYNNENEIPFLGTLEFIISGYKYLKNNKKNISLTQFINKLLSLSFKTEQPIYEIIENVLSNEISLNKNKENFSLQQYFKEVNTIYEKNNNNFNIPFSLENRNKIIEMNLKNVISIAKKYSNFGVQFEDLISAGNEGLIHAFDKFSPKKAILKDNLLNEFNKIQTWPISYSQIENIITQYITYGKLLNKFKTYFSSQKVYEKSDIEKWISKNVNNAKFNSVAVMWIRAYILQEINNKSQLIHTPKSENCKNITISLDKNIDNSNHILDEIFYLKEESNIETLENKDEALSNIQDSLKKMFQGIKPRNKIIVLNRFGIGLPRPMTTQEISSSEGLSTTRISQIVNSTLKEMKKNAIKENIDIKKIFSQVNLL